MNGASGVENTGAKKDGRNMDAISKQNWCDVAVVGGGPTGLVAAIALAQSGARVALVARRAPYGDNRTTALLGGSVDFLTQLDVWRRFEDKAAAPQTMGLVDDTKRLVRAPEVRFACHEIGLESFGYNVENQVL